MTRTPSFLIPLLASSLAACGRQPQQPSRGSISSDFGDDAAPARQGGVARARPAGAPDVQPAVARPATSASPFARTRFQPFQIVDRQQGGLIVGTLAVPEGWRAESQVAWTYPDVSFPVRLSARVASPDGSAWIETYPAEMFYWLEPHDVYTQVGARTLGMVHQPGIGVQDAMQRFLIQRHRGRAQGLTLLGTRPIPNLPQALGQPAIPGESLAARVRYTLGGRTVDEEFFCHLSAPERIPYTGPQGTTYESHRVLSYAFSMGAADGRLDGLAPLLAFIARSFRPDQVWQRHAAQVQAFLNAEFNRSIAQGYQRIAAAGALSRAISANNDAMLASMEAQRVAAASRPAARSRESVNEGFSEYIRGVEKMEDPYWGTSDQSYTSKYHWTDGFGSYQHSNDANFNPNIGGTQNWQLMRPAR